MISNKLSRQSSSSSALKLPVLSAGDGNTTRNSLSSSVMNTGGIEIPEQYSWLHHQNTFLKRLNDLNTAHSTHRADLWAEIECLIDDLQSVSAGLPDDLARKMNHIKAKMKKNFQLQIDIENESNLDAKCNRKWSDEVSVYVRSNGQTQQQETRQVEQQLLAKVERLEKLEVNRKKEVEKLSRNVDTLQSEYTKLKSSFSAASCVSFLDTFQKYIQLIKSDIIKLSRK